MQQISNIIANAKMQYICNELQSKFVQLYSKFVNFQYTYHAYRFKKYLIDDK